MSIIPKIILNGTKIIVMNIGTKIEFLDSLNYFYMKLSAFGFQDENCKGWFPHLFNKFENRHYIASVPPKEYYASENMNTAEKIKFEEWYHNALNNNYIFNFENEILKYCRSDVDILSKACFAFRKNFIEVGGTCPFTEACTIASACSKLYRKSFLKDDIISIIPAGGYRKTNNHSRISLEWLLVLEKETGHDIIHAGSNHEYRLKENILVDGYYEDENNLNYVYLFHGCFWHGCNRCFVGEKRYNKI